MMMQQLVDWVDERIDLSALRHFVAEKGVPVHAGVIMIHAQFVRHWHSLQGNAAQGDPTRALEERNSHAGGVKGEGKIPRADRANQIHRKDVADISVHGTHQNNRARANIKH